MPNPVGVYLGTAVFATGIAFLFPALLALAVARVDETERGTVVGTTTAFVDLSFGVAPALLGLAVGVIGFGGIFIVVRGDRARRQRPPPGPSRDAGPPRADRTE